MLLFAFNVLQWLLAAMGLLTLIGSLCLAVPLARPPALASIHAGALAVDRGAMPGPLRFQARDGSVLAYRLYPGGESARQRIVVLIHGSSGQSDNMNELSRRLAAEGIAAIAPDIRGHGSSGTRGDISYIGQLDDDLEDLVTELRRQFPRTRLDLLGFSSGGGFALRIAAGKLAGNFDHVVLLSPFLGVDAPSTRSTKHSARWANVDMPRIVTLEILRRLGLRCCEALPVIAFATSPGAERNVTSHYSYRLLMNFNAPADVTAAFRSLSARTTIIAGGQDELMASDKYAEIVRGISPAINVRILPGLDHMSMLHAPVALDAAIEALRE